MSNNNGISIARNIKKNNKKSKNKPNFLFNIFTTA